MINDEHHSRWPDAPHPEQVKKKVRPVSKPRGGKSKKHNHRKRLWDLDHRCRYCLRELTLEESTLDHLWSRRSAERKTGRGQFTLACFDCNGRKGSLPPTGEWEPKFLP